MLFYILLYDYRQTMIDDMVVKISIWINKELVKRIREMITSEQL
jgi:hypothetical protein